MIKNLEYDLVNECEVLSDISHSALLYFEEIRNDTSPNDTTPLHEFKTRGTETNIDAVFSAKGDGALLNDSTGDKRGRYAIDLQKQRTDDSQIASGDNAIIIGGANNKASVNFATVINAQDAVANCYGQIVHSNGKLDYVGDSQSSELQYFGRTTGPAQTVNLALNNSGEQKWMKEKRTELYHILVTAKTCETISGSYGSKGWYCYVLVETRANNTDIFIIGTPTLEVVGESLGYDPPLYTTLNWNIDFDVDNTNGALLIKATIENEKPGRVIKWRATAKTSEIGFS